ncbi:tetratricopeptide repeat protein [bacterium]|nr:tetratricopeptide repeat protein [bacterium]
MDADEARLQERKTGTASVKTAGTKRAPGRKAGRRRNALAVRFTDGFRRVRPAFNARAWILAGLLLLVALWVANPAPHHVGSGSNPSAHESGPDRIHALLITAEQEILDSRYAPSMASYRRALALASAAGDWSSVVRSLNGIGENRIQRMEFEAAESAFDSAMRIADTRLGAGRPETAGAWLGLGRIRFERGDFNGALDCYFRALPLAAAHGPLLGLAYGRIGQVYIARTRYPSALAYLDTAVAVLRKNRDENHPDLAQVYLQMGNVYKSRHDWENAGLFYGRALDINRLHFGDLHPETGRAYENLGSLALLEDDFATAMNFQRKALSAYAASLGPDHPSVAGVYNHMGYIYWRQKKTAAAERNFDKCLEVCSRDRDATLLHAAQALYRIGHIRVRRGELDDALAFYGKSLDLRLEKLGRHSFWTAESHKAIANVHRKKGNYTDALRSLQDAVLAVVPDFNGYDPALNPAVDDPDVDFNMLPLLRLKAETFGERYSRAGRSPADLRAALSNWELAMRLMDRIGGGMLSVEPRLDLASDYAFMFERAIETALELHRLTGDERFMEKAFSFSEKSKVIVQMRSVMDKQAMRLGRIPADLIEKENRLRIEFRDCKKVIRDEMGNGTAADENRLKLLEARRFRIKREWDEIIGRFDREYPEFLSLRYGTVTVTVEDLRERLLKPEDALVEYFIGERFITIFVVTDSLFETVRIARHPELARRVRGMREGIAGMDYGRYTKDAFWCYRTLFRPIEPWVRGRSLIVVPDGVLGGLAFEALLTAEPDTKKKDYRSLAYLIRDYPVTYHHSAMLHLKYYAGREMDHSGPYLGFAPGRY